MNVARTSEKSTSSAAKATPARAASHSKDTKRHTGDRAQDSGAAYKVELSGRQPEPSQEEVEE